eukprot:jgi/Mesvir1/22944/Mv19454-RA.1
MRSLDAFTTTHRHRPALVALAVTTWTILALAVLAPVMIQDMPRVSAASTPWQTLLPRTLSHDDPAHCIRTGCDRGNCDADDGACHCQYGFGGARCNEYLLRSCHFGPTDGEGWAPPRVPPSFSSVWESGVFVSCLCLSELQFANGPRGHRETAWNKYDHECFVRAPLERRVSRDQLLHMQHSGHPQLPLEPSGYHSVPNERSGDHPPSRLVRVIWADFDAAMFLAACSFTGGGGGKQNNNDAIDGDSIDSTSSTNDDTEKSIHDNSTNAYRVGDGDYRSGSGMGNLKACAQLVVTFERRLRMRRDRFHAVTAPANRLPDSECVRQVDICRQVAVGNSTHPGVISIDGVNSNAARGNDNATLLPPACCDPAGGRCEGPSPDTQDRTHCECIRGMVGDRCEIPCDLGCVHDCSGHGTCWARWCLCDPGWSGIDCSQSGEDANSDPERLQGAKGTPLPPPPPPPRHVSELKIYVYDIPAFVQHNEPCQGCTDLCGGPYDATTFWLARLLRDPAHLTRDPGGAHLFYAPLRAFPISGNGLEVSRHIRDVLSVIRDMGYFERSGGRDHVWWVQQDVGTCKVTHLVRPGIIVGHYGRLDVWGRSFNRVSKQPPCMDPGKDLVVPALTPLSGAAVVREGGDTNMASMTGNAKYLQDKATAQALAVFRDNWRDVPRPTFLYFSGANVPLVHPQCADVGNDSATCRDVEYAMGICAAVFAWFGKNARGMGDVRVTEEYNPEVYYDELQASRFCLDMPGSGFSFRILDYVASGCIPVIVRDDILWPYESYEYGGDDHSNWQQESPQGEWDDLPRVHYPEFALTFRKKDIPTILASLRNITAERVRELQAGVQRVHRAFLWDQEYGYAYKYTLFGLTRLRAKMEL